MQKTITRKRMNVTLPHETVRLIDRIAEKGDRSRFLDEAVRFYVRQRGSANLRRMLEEGALHRAERDLSLARDWFPVEQEIWRRKKNR